MSFLRGACGSGRMDSDSHERLGYERFDMTIMGERPKCYVVECVFVAIPKDGWQTL